MGEPVVKGFCHSLLASGRLVHHGQAERLSDGTFSPCNRWLGWSSPHTQLERPLRVPSQNDVPMEGRKTKGVLVLATDKLVAIQHEGVAPATERHGLIGALDADGVVAEDGSAERVCV